MPTNLHILIGRNGVGKTHLINNMINSLLKNNSLHFGIFESKLENHDQELFANLVSVSFSAFDPFKPIPEKKNKSFGMNYSYIGLQKWKKEANEASSGDFDMNFPKSIDMLTKEFVESFNYLRQSARIIRWTRAVNKLEADPIFKAIDVSSFASESKDDSTLSSIFRKLSSGHKIILLTITKLAEKVEEKSLVLMDEPEAHLHPPLLSAFTRALSDLLISRNAVAIMATHSPVMLQEVPRSCVWKLNRSGREITVDRPETETFGENIGTLTREVFGLEVTQSGFHNLLNSVVEEEDDFNEIIKEFNGELGMEAKAIVRALLANRKRGQK